MNHSKLILSLSCFVAVTLASPLATAAPRGGGGHGGGHFSGGRSFGGRPGMGAGGGRSWNGRNWSGRNWNGRNWHGHGHNNVIFIGDFGFPGWWGWGWGGYPYGGYPYYGYYDYGYPYGYNGYGYGYGYPGYGYNNYGGNGYGNSSQYTSPTRSKVAELQRRLSRAGYYRGSVDGILGPQTRRAIRAYESDHGYADAG